MADASFSKLRVLVVDDEAFSRQFIARVLGTLGVNDVTAAKSGVEALGLLENASETIDIVISDIEMPEMDGYELTRKIRYGAVPAYKSVPILILTGKDTEKNVQKARFHKVNGFIVKPPDAVDLERKLRYALSS